MPLDGVIAVSTICGAIIAAITVALMIGRPLRHLLRQNNEFREDWYGTPARPGRAAQPGVPERLARIEQEMRPNHGSSLRDAVNRMEQRQLVQEQRLSDHLTAHLSMGVRHPNSPSTAEG